MDDTRRSLELAGVYELLTATGIDDGRIAFAETRIEHVIMRAGIDPDTRLESATWWSPFARPRD